MKKHKKLCIILSFIAVILLLSSFVAMKLGVFPGNDHVPISPNLSNFANGGEIDESIRVYDRYGSSGGYTPLILDVKNCQVGKDGVYFGFGHTEFLIIGKQNTTCVFKYGTEIENPNWDGKLDTRCKVPTSRSVSLTLNDHGIDFSPIKQFCSE